MSLVIFCLLFSSIAYVPVKGEIIWYLSLTAWLIYRVLGWQLFFISALWIILFCYFPASKVSAGKPADSLTEDTLYVTSHFSHVLSRFFLSFDSHSLWCILVCASLHLSGFKLIRLLGYVNPCLASNLGHFQPLFLQIISLPLPFPSWFLIVFVLVYFTALPKSLGPVHFFSFVFLSAPQMW